MVVILGILAGVVVFSVTDRSESSAVKTDARTIHMAHVEQGFLSSLSTTHVSGPSCGAAGSCFVTICQVDMGCGAS